jgi:hypothetical protein
MKRLEVVDGLFSEEESIDFVKHIIHYNFQYGERDSANLPPTGMVHYLDELNPIYKKVLQRTEQAFPDLSTATIERKYVNFFMPCEYPNFHQDGHGITVLHYITDFYDQMQGGETQFIDDNQNIVGIFPKPGRVVLFDGMIMHRATSYKSHPRLTLAIKYKG